jgi:hypothetical protein
VERSISESTKARRKFGNDAYTSKGVEVSVMAQRQPEEKTTLEQVLQLVDKLSSSEQERLRINLNSKSKTERWKALFNKVQGQCIDLPPISEAEILADLKEIRTELKAERAGQSGN